MGTSAREQARELLSNVPPLMHWLRSEVRKAMPGMVTLQQFRILTHLERGLETTSELAECMGTTLPALSRAIDRMVKLGWIQRRPNLSDRRLIRLSLTPLGKRIFRQAQSDVEAQLGLRLAELSAMDSRRVSDALAALFELQKMLPAAARV